MRRFLVVVIPLALVIACSSSSRTSFVGPLEAGDAGAADGGAPGDAPVFGDAGKKKDGAAGSQCERDVAMGALTISNPSCFVNEHVSNKTTKLSFGCAGGSATATFGGHVFSGSVSGDVIALTDVETFLFNGCQWQSTETIEGDLSKGTLQYSYTEKPVVSCPETPCTASGAVAVAAGAVIVVN